MLDLKKKKKLIQTFCKAKTNQYSELFTDLCSYCTKRGIKKKKRKKGIGIDKKIYSQNALLFLGNGST